VKLSVMPPGVVSPPRKGMLLVVGPGREMQPPSGHAVGVGQTPPLLGQVSVCSMELQTSGAV
jgi:hypothetical protein